MPAAPSRVLWLIEHVDRELDLACLFKARLEASGEAEVEIRHIYLDVERFRRGPAPRLVVLPFFYRATDQVISDLVRRWPTTVFLTLSFEQIFSRASVKTKIPVDDFTRRNVLHHAWGTFYRDHLVAYGVSPENVVLNGNPVYALYSEPYRRFFPTRDELAAKYGLDPNRTWLWVPEDHRYAFFGDDRIAQLTSLGADPKELASLRDFSRRALVDILKWSTEAGRELGMEVILRPRPAVHTDQLRAFYESHVGRIGPPVHVIKGESAREWILTADWMVSAFSTTLIEGALLEKASFSVEPVPTPDSYFAAWHPFAPRIRTREEFLAAARDFRADAKKAEGLAEWARREMLANGDPVEGLLTAVRAAISGKVRPVGGAAVPPKPRPSSLKEWINSFRSASRHFSSVFHEKDRFDETTVAERVSRWRAVFPRA